MRRRRWRRIALGVVVIIVIAGIVSAATEKHSHHAKSSVSKPDEEKPQKSSVVLTGLGATSAAWNSHHRADPRFARGSSYDPEHDLVAREGERFDDRYYGVTRMGGKVMLYNMRFPPGTTIAEARQEIMRSEFPKDTRVSSFRELSTCALMTVESKALLRVTKLKGYVEFTSGESTLEYHPNDVWGAIVTSSRITEC